MAMITLWARLLSRPNYPSFYQHPEWTSVSYLSTGKGFIVQFDETSVIEGIYLVHLVST